MKTILIKQACLVNEGKLQYADVLVKNGYIEKISATPINQKTDIELNGEGLHLFPGAIDDQVHFREPGLTQKGEIYTEAKAAVAGGITSYMEMPNTVPNTLTQELLEDKYRIASQRSLANYSFYMGTSNDNFEELMKTDPRKVCGIKIFMGASTGNMLVDDPMVLEKIFSQCNQLIATHCEHEPTIKRNTEVYKQKFGDDIPVSFHPVIRSEEACYLSSSFAIDLAKRNNTRLHILHISTAREVDLFRNDIPLKDKRITAEACIHHLWFSDEDYKTKGILLKWNPAVKTAADRDAILKAVLDNRIDVIATDHAPHTLEEKANLYTKAPSGGPLVQHSMQAMIELYHRGKISLERIAEKMSHAVADCFQIEKRGYLREGYYADMVLVNLNKPKTVTRDSLLYKCGWSPFEGTTFSSSIEHTIVSGHLVYSNGHFNEDKKGERLSFNRN
ncbi:MAG: dihydroorotase [Bacteroidia bacterium]|nr:dihydroorotase [Bacteroidia bacterium]